MELRREYLNAFTDILRDMDVSVLNIYGETGMGKTHLIKQMTSDPVIGSHIIGGLLDISRFEGMSDRAVTENLYAICDILTSCSRFRPLKFCVADAIDSKRASRKSYAERMAAAKENKPAPAYADAVADIKELTSIFFDLSSLNDVMTIWNITKKYYNKFKPRTPAERSLYKQLEGLDERDLRDMLPQTLADDINSFNVDEDKRIVIFVDNFNRLSDFRLKGSWLNTLIDKAREVLWVFVSREKMNIDHPRVRYKLVGGIPETEMNDFFLKNGIDNEPHRRRMIAMCNGSPFFAKKILDITKSGGVMSEAEWESIERRGINGIATTFINHIDADKRELLYILSNAEDFDAATFEQLFPERIFSLNKPWFETSVFERVGDNAYAVQSSTRDIIRAHLRETDPAINRECRRKLFGAEFALLKKYSEGAPIPDGVSLPRHLSDMCIYAAELGDERFYGALVQLKPLFIRYDEINLYYDSMEMIAERCGGSALGIKALFEMAVLDLLRGCYRKAEKLAAKGCALSRESGDDMTAMKFLTISMEVAETSPADTENAARQMSSLAEEYLGILENLSSSLSYKQYITNRMTAHIYAAKAYTVSENHAKANEYLDYIFDVCSDERKMSSLSLYRICARAYEVKGNMHGTGRPDEETNLILRRSVEMYDIAEAQQRAWDTNFQMNCAKAHKRLAENSLKLGDYDTGIYHCSNALSRYEVIKRNDPDNIYLYCSICFTLTDCAHYLIDNYEELAEEYLDKAIKTADDALGLFYAGDSDVPAGNRHLCNTRCIANRNKGQIRVKRGEPEQAEEFYRRALSAAEDSIKTAPTHPYGYYEYAMTCDKLAELYRSTGRLEDAGAVAANGRESVLKSRRYTENPNSFADLFARLSV